MDADSVSALGTGATLDLRSNSGVLTFVVGAKGASRPRRKKRPHAVLVPSRAGPPLLRRFSSDGGGFESLPGARP